MSIRQNYKEKEQCKQAIVFKRVSSDDQVKGNSLETQDKVVKDYCYNKGFSIIKEFEISESSTKGDRKQFDAMLEFVSSQSTKTAIVVYCVDRFQRSFSDKSKVIPLLKQDKTEIHFCCENLVLDKETNSSDKMRWNIGIFSAEMYTDTMSDKIRSVMQNNMANGKWQSKIGVGYKNTRDINNKAIIAVDDDRAPIIKHLFELYATGNYSLKQLEEVAKERRLTVYRSKTNQTLKRTQIQKILKNPFYCGFVYYKNELIPHIYPAIIEKSLFDKVQEKFENKNKLYQKGEYREKQYALRGLIRCSCGCLMTPEYHKKNGLEYVIMRCSKTRGECNQGLLNQNYIFKQLADEVFNKVKLSKPILELLRKSANKSLAEEIQQNTIYKREITAKLTELQAKEDKLFDLYLNSKIPQVKYDSETIRIERERQELIKIQNNCFEVGAKVKGAINNALDLSAKLKEIMSSDETTIKGEVLRLLFESPVLDGNILKYTIRKPFDRILGLDNYKRSLRFDNDCLSSFEYIADDIQMIMNKI